MASGETRSSPLFRTRPDAFAIEPATPGTLALGGSIHLSEGLSNSYLVITPHGRVVINTGMGFEAPIHRTNYDAIDDGPIRYVLLTQGHVDHVGGVDAFLEEGTEVVAQAGNAAQQADDARIAAFRARRSAFAFADAIARAGRYAKQNAGGRRPSQSRPTPTLGFDDRHAFELGGVRFELLATPGGETLDSMVVWLPDRRVCFTGNLFSALFGHFPNLVTIRGDRYREPLRFVESLERVRALEPERLLVGHGGPVDGAGVIRAELERLRDAVLYVHDETVRGMNQGRDLYELMREIRLPPELRVGEGYGKVSWGVRAIWENYAGWFQHRSAAELYPAPPGAVHPELVELAGGPDAVAERAHRRLGAGQAVLALQLAEAALAAEAGHRGALEASLAAHVALEKESSNFWQLSFLRRQIADLRQRLGAGG